MSVTVDFYSSSDDNIVLNKTPIYIKSKSLDFRDNVDVLNPKIIILYDDDLKNCNYAKITAFDNRYYFARIVVLTGNRMLISFEVDVLKTYEEGIKDIVCIINRTGQLSKPTYIIDKEFPIENGRIGDITTPILFSSPHGTETTHTYHIVLHTI